MAEARIHILIPTFNNVNEIDLTMESIQKQDYDAKNIYVTIVDFGSEDGTYEKIMHYNRKHLGFYTRPFQKNRRQRLADMAGILEKVCRWEFYEQTEATHCFSLVLYPGDIMYPNCLTVLTNSYIKHYGLNPAMVICESDVFTEDGTVRKQKPLFYENCIIDGRQQADEYLKRGYMHQIFQILPGNLHRERIRRSYAKNEGRCWSKLYWEGNGRIAVYIHEPLVCTRRVEYDDELQEILLRWEMYLTLPIYQEIKFGAEFNRFIKIPNENMAEYALWKSFCMYQKEKDWKDIEDCFLIAAVIAPEIKNKEIYQNMEKLILQQDETMKDAVEQYFVGQE